VIQTAARRAGTTNPALHVLHSVLWHGSGVFLVMFNWQRLPFDCCSVEAEGLSRLETIHTYIRSFVACLEPLCCLGR